MNCDSDTILRPDAVQYKEFYNAACQKVKTEKMSFVSAFEHTLIGGALF